MPVPLPELSQPDPVRQLRRTTTTICRSSSRTSSDRRGSGRYLTATTRQGSGRLEPQATVPELNGKPTNWSRSSPPTQPRSTAPSPLYQQRQLTQQPT